MVSEEDNGGGQSHNGSNISWNLFLHILFLAQDVA